MGSRMEAISLTQGKTCGGAGRGRCVSNSTCKSKCYSPPPREPCSLAKPSCGGEAQRLAGWAIKPAISARRL
jgi:hypothetical protein